MGTREYLIDKLKKELTVAQYEKRGDWFLMHIDKILTNYSAVYGSGIVVETDYGNVLYYETKEPTEKELQEYLQD